MKFLAMLITNKQIILYIFTVGNVLNIFMEHDLYLMSKWFLALKKIYNFDPDNVFFGYFYKYTPAS